MISFASFRLGSGKEIARDEGILCQEGSVDAATQVFVVMLV